MSDTQLLKQLLADADARFWPELKRISLETESFGDLLVLANLRRRACRDRSIPCPPREGPATRIALVGGSTLYPFSALLEHMLFVNAVDARLFIGDYNNFRSEMLDAESPLHEFRPQIVIVIPDEQSCKYTGRLTDPIELQRQAVDSHVSELLALCEAVNSRCGASVILCNFIPPPYFDLGPFRARSLGSDWNFRKAVNLELGTRAPYYVHICDLEFLAYRLGGLAAKDEKAWFETKQLCSPALQVQIAREAARMVARLKLAPKKVLALDLDNTLWGGVIGDDGLEGIELGDTSPRGEAFKAFQKYVASLTDRGLLLAVCSKNETANALEPFQKHPEMALKESHFVAFKANWDPKPDNLRAMAAELNLGLDSFVFADDNPAEVEIVRQFTPEVTAIHLGEDPSTFVKQLQESRLFERLAITTEDLARTDQYREEAQRQMLLSTAGDMESYLRSLAMRGVRRSFNALDLPRIAQLINKSNQFNLTTRRRTESELAALMRDASFRGFSIRLEDRFGDYGLIAVIICRLIEDSVCDVDTWLMSCRVLKRQVEEQTLNEIVRAARSLGANRIRGTYLPTKKNAMVSDLYSKLGFQTLQQTETAAIYELPLAKWQPFVTSIAMETEQPEN